jgi:ribonucleoside-triphosphate reductase (thioredoxin)
MAESSALTCRKRNGTVVPFDDAKIRLAMTRCFAAVAGDDLEAVDRHVPTIDRITRNVVGIVFGSGEACPDIETIQRYVIQQLWAEGLFGHAEHYQNYREERRKARLRAPVAPEVQARFDEMRGHFPTDLQAYQFMSKFSRWREEDRRRETWHETVHERVCPWLFRLPGVTLTEAEKAELTEGTCNLEVSPAMRVVQMAGPALDRCHVGAYNCAYHPLQDIRAFSELLYILMQGTGAGFSVESDYVSQLPRIKKQSGKRETLVCEDSTEGWCETYDRHLELLWDGWDTHVDVSKVRPKNSRLKTKGGRSSGPGPFLELIAFSRHLLKARQGRYLEDIDAHDLGCKTGTIVQVGGVRRAAEISLSDLDSRAMREAKSGNWYQHSVHRTMANNSAVYDFSEGVPVETFMEEWLALVKSKSGERGIFNRQAALKRRPARRLAWRFGCNPCAEILLRPFQFCNLSIAIARSWDTVESLKRKVRLAAYFGKIQSMATKFGYLRDDWRRNCTEERLLGVDITGHADCPLLRPGAPGRAELLRLLAREVEQVDIALSARWGINRSAANTTIKPGGDSAVFFNCASGVSPWFDEYAVRWVREPKDTPVARFLRDSGVPHADAPERPGELAVFGFPRAAPPGATRRNDLSALQQLENWLEWKENWAEHSVSATIYVEEHEWPEVGAWVYRHLDQVTGLSFLPKDNGIYTYAPNESLSREQYEAMVVAFPVLDWAKLSGYETEDETTSRQTFACVGDSC